MKLLLSLVLLGEELREELREVERLGWRLGHVVPRAQTEGGLAFFHPKFVAINDDSAHILDCIVKLLLLQKLIILKALEEFRGTREELKLFRSCVLQGLALVDCRVRLTASRDTAKLPRDNRICFEIIVSMSESASYWLASKWVCRLSRSIQFSRSVLGGSFRPRAGTRPSYQATPR